MDLDGDGLDESIARAMLGSRYRVVGCIARGSMGIVFRAIDEALGRPIAIKLGHGRSSGSRPRDPEIVRERLKVEARAMAGVCHPNVVPLFAIASTGPQVAIAMELVDGQTLGEWLASPRRWREIVDVLCAAGEGLVAAHAAGVVHRDIKPDNVLVGQDGRTRITDFGLAMIVGMQVLPTEDEHGEVPEQAASLTQTGMAVGTPAYMAIEQHTGGVLDHRTDQFAFCATAYEALFGVRPFVGNTPLAIARAKRRMQITAPLRGADVPTEVRAAIVRGLCPDPDARHPSMAALLATLRAAAIERPWRWRGAAVASALVVAAAVLAVLPAGATPPRDAPAAKSTASSTARLVVTPGTPDAVLADQYFDALALGHFTTAADAADLLAARMMFAQPELESPWRRHAMVARERAGGRAAAPLRSGAGSTVVFRSGR